MAGWHHQHDGRELGKTLGDAEAQGSLVCAVIGAAKSRTLLSE